MSQNHVIQKVFVEITVSNKEKAHYIKNDINGFLSVDVFPEIENYINDIESQLAGRTLQIPLLEMDLDIKNSSLNTELKDKIAELFKEKLSEIINSVEISDEKNERSKPSWINHQEKMLQTFIYFLENGSMPWWNSDKLSVGLLETSVFEDLVSAPGFRKNIISILPKKYVQDRIIHQLSDTQIAQLCSAVLENEVLKISFHFEKINELSGMNYHDRDFIWHLILEILTKQKDSPEIELRQYFLEQISSHLIKKSSLKKRKAFTHIFPFITENDIAESIKNREKSKNIEDTKNHESITENGNDEKSIINSEIIHKNHEKINDEEIPDDGQYVQNAGLILIHPFIKTFFEHCNLLDIETLQLTDPDLCAHLLHFIATGNTNAPEYEMVFEKFLCNIPVNQSIKRNIKLSSRHKTQAKNVIESVQHNWSAMRKSSAALLQNEFFQRPGKLVVTDYDYTLTVERKTQDILLDKLAWGIGFVKLPWKEKFMLVNW